MGLQPDYKSLPESEIKFCTPGPRLMNEKKKGKQRQQEPDLLKNKGDNIKLCHWFPRFPFLSLLSNLI